MAFQRGHVGVGERGECQGRVPRPAAKQGMVCTTSRIPTPRLPCGRRPPTSPLPHLPDSSTHLHGRSKPGTMAANVLPSRMRPKWRYDACALSPVCVRVCVRARARVCVCTCAVHVRRARAHTYTGADTRTRPSHTHPPTHTLPPIPTSTRTHSSVRIHAPMRAYTRVKHTPMHEHPTHELPQSSCAPLLPTASLPWIFNAINPCPSCTQTARPTYLTHLTPIQDTHAPTARHTH